MASVTVTIDDDILSKLDALVTSYNAISSATDITRDNLLELGAAVISLQGEGFLGDTDYFGVNELYGIALNVYAEDGTPFTIANIDNQSAVPTVGTDPADTSIATGADGTLTVVATNADEYQWFKDGSAIVDADSASFAITTAAAGDAGVYKVRVTNNVGSVFSDDATVTIT